MKTITLHRPNTIQNALSDFDRYFESFFGDSVFTPTNRIMNRMPAVDLRETEKAYILEMELPGHDETDIEIHVDGSSLSVASRQEQAANPDSGEAGTWLIRERRASSFSRSFKLPENADSEGVNARFKNGVLALEIAKKAEAQRRAIRINAG